MGGRGGEGGTALHRRGGRSVAGNGPGGGEAWGEETVLGEEDVDGIEEALVEGNVTLGKQPEDVYDGASNDSGGCIKVGGVTRRGSGKVEGSPAVADGDGDDGGGVRHGRGRQGARWPTFRY